MPNIMKQPIHKAGVAEGTEKVKLLKLTPRFGVQWYEDSNAAVVDSELQLQDGYIIRQRDVFSFCFNSNLGKLIRAAIGVPGNTFIEEIDLNEVIGKEVIGEVYYWKTARGDVYERVKNFRAADDNQSPDSAEFNQ